MYSLYSKFITESWHCVLHLVSENKGKGKVVPVLN